MSFESLDRVLGSLKQQSHWQNQPFQRLLKCWPETVGAAIAAHTQPVSLQRDVLWVATSSAVWSQELTLRRQSILEKLNGQLPSSLADIRFSTAQWQRPQDTSSATPLTDLRREHPSYLTDVPLPDVDDKPSQTPKAAFQHWAKVVQARSQGLPLCPHCQCPTPPGELQRWAMCSICAGTYKLTRE